MLILSVCQLTHPTYYSIDGYNSSLGESQLQVANKSSWLRCCGDNGTGRGEKNV